MKHGIGRKLLSVVLAVMMLVSLLPTTAFADDVSSYSAKNIVVNDVVDDSNTGNDTEPAGEDTNVGNGGNDVGNNATAVNNSSDDEADEGKTKIAPQAAEPTGVAKIGNTGYETLAEAINAATTGDTIVLLRDVTENDAADSAKTNEAYDLTGKTLDLNGKTYSSNNFAHVFEGTGGTIKNGKMVCLNNGSYALFIGNGGPTTSFTVEDVELTGGINIYDATGVVLKNLTVNASNYYAVWLDEGSAATIEGGTYTAGNGALLNGCKKSPLSITDGTFKTNGKDLMGASGGTLSISGGTFDTAVDEKYCAEGFTVAKDADGKYGVTKDTAETAVNLDKFLTMLEKSNYTFDGMTDGKKLQVKWSPVSGCYDTREGHKCTVNNVTATGNTPNRVSAKYAQYQLLSGLTQNVTIKNVKFIYTPGAFTICANSDWRGDGTATNLAELQFENKGDVKLLDCSFDGVAVAVYNDIETATTVVHGCSFSNMTKDGGGYAIHYLKGGKIDVSKNTFTDVYRGMLVQSTVNKEVNIVNNDFSNIDANDSNRYMVKLLNTTDTDIVISGNKTADNAAVNVNVAYDSDAGKAIAVENRISAIHTAKNGGNTISIASAGDALGDTYKAPTAATEDVTDITVGEDGNVTATIPAAAAYVAKVNGTEYATLDDAIKAVADGETIVVNAGEYKLNGSLTYAGKAFTIKAADGAQVSFDMTNAVTLGSAKITFNNVTFDYKTNGNYIGLQHADTLVYNKCTIKGMAFLYATNETFNNCTFNQTSADAYNVWTYGAKNVAFNGCTFNCVGKSVLVYNEGTNTKTDLTVTDTKFIASAPVAGKAAIEIDTSLMTGGATITVDGNTKANGFAEGSNSKNTLWNDKKQTADTNKNTTVTVAGETVFEPHAAKIGTTYYASLTDAITAAEAGQTVTLLADTTEDVVIDKNITLNLGGKTLTNTNAGKDTIFVANGVTATVKNGSVKGGTGHYNIAVGTEAMPGGTLTLEGVTATAGNTGSSMIDNWGTLTINSGTYTGGMNTVKSEEGSTLTINGGTFTCDFGKKWSYTAVILVYGDTTINGGEFIQKTTNTSSYAAVVMTGIVDGYTATTKITDGKFTNEKLSRIFWALGKATSDNFKVSGGTFNKSVSDSYMADGYIPVKNADGTYGVKEGKFVADVGSTGYETFDEAIAAANASTNSKTVYLRENITVDHQLVIENTKGKTITLDLSGKTLTSTYVIGASDKNGSYALVNKTPLTIKNGTFAAGDARAIGALATLTLDEATVSQTLTGGHACVAFCADGKSYTIKNNSTINGAYAVCNFANNATITINDSKLIGTGNTLYHNGSNYGLKLTVTNTTIEGNGNGCGVYISGSTSAQSNTANQNGVGGYQQATFTNCTISGTNGVEVKYTDLTLDNCTVSATVKNPSYKQDNNGPAGEGFAVVSTDNAMNNATPKPEGTVTITGKGNYTGLVGLGALASVKETYEGFTDNTIKVSGGTFNNTVLPEYCADGFIPTKNADGTYGVKKGTYVAEVNGVKYESLQAAIDAAESGATVKMLADTKENVTISRKLTLDLNGFTLNGGQVKATPALKIDNASVTVKDSSENQNGTIMREDTAENSGVSSHYVIDIQGKYGFLKFEGGNVKNDSGNDAAKGASLIRLGNDSVSAWPTLTIKGGKFTQDNFIAIKVDRGTLHFMGGEVNSANSYAIENWNNAYIKGGTVNGTVSTWVYSTGAAFSKLEISGGTVNGNVASVNYDKAADKQARVFITGGEITGTLGTYTYNNGLDRIENTSMATIEVTAGTFDIDPTKYVVEGSTVKTNSEGKFGVEKAYLAKIGETSYYTMDEAFHAVKAGETIVMLRDYTTDAVQNSGYDSFTIDLNEHTWTYTGTDTDCAAFEINYSDVTLTVKNGKVVSNSMVGLIPSAMSGTITYDNAGLVFEGVEMTANGHSGIETNGGNTNDTVTLKNSTLNVPNGYGIYFPSSGKLTIDNSVINAKTMGVQVCAGSLNITGDKTAITVTGDAVPKTENDGAIQDGAAISIVNRTGYKGLDKIEVTGGTFKANGTNAAIKAYDWANNVATEFTANANVAVSGGTFSSAVPAGLCKDGYVPAVGADGNYTVELKKVAEYNGTQYSSLQEAIDAASQQSYGQTEVKLLCDLTITETIVFAKKYSDGSVLLNLGGYTLTGNDCRALQINKGSLYLENGTVTSTGIVNSSSVIRIGSNETTYNGATPMLYMQKDAKVVAPDSYGVTIFGSATRGEKLKVMSNAEIIATGPSPAISGNGGANYNTDDRTSGWKAEEIIIGENAVISAANNYAIYHPECGTLNIQGGTITGTGGIQMCSGTLKISNSPKITANGSADYDYTGDAGVVYDAAAISVINRGYPQGPATATIKGTPTVTAANGEVIHAFTWSNSNKTDGEWAEAGDYINVSGGTYNKKFNEAYLAADCTLVTNSEGGYTVEQKPVAEYNSTQYTSLAQAILDANMAGGTVKLLDNVTLTNSLGIGGTAKVTLDLNKKILTLDGAQLYTQGSATVTINNGTIKRTDVPTSGSANNFAIQVMSGSTLLLGGSSVMKKLTLTGKYGIYNVGGLLNVQYADITTDGWSIAVSDSTSKTGSVIIGNVGTAKIVSRSGNCIGTAVNSKPNVTISKGTLTSNGTTWDAGVVYWASEGTLTITGGTFTASSAEGSEAAAVYQKNGTVKISGTTAKLLGSNALVVKSGEGSTGTMVTELSGGTYSTKPNEAWVVEGKEIHEVTEGYKVESEYVVEVTHADGTTTSFDAWAKLSSVWNESGATIKLLKDTTTAELVATNGDLTIDFNGKTLTVTEDASSTQAYMAAIIVHKGGKLTLKDSSEAGNGGMTATNVYGVEVITGSSVTVESGSYNCDTSVVQVDNGTAYIEGGTFQTEAADKRYLLNCIDPAFKDGTAKMEVTGGTFYGFDPSANPEGEGTTYVKTGYVSTNNGDGTYTVEEYKPVEVWTGYTGTKVASYATIKEAVANLGDTKWIVIGKDYTLTEDFTIGGEGFDNLYLDVVEGATLTVAEGVTLTVAANAKRLGVRDGATLVNKGTIVVCGSSTSNGFAMLYGTFTGNELTVPEGCFLDNNGKNFFATANGNAVYEITFGDGTVKKTADSTNIKGGNVKQIKLLKDVTNGGWTLDSSSVGAEVVLDLNGHTISYNGANRYYATLNVYTKVTIKNGTVEYEGSKRGAIDLVGQGDLTIERDVTIDGGDGFAIFTSGTSKLTVNGKVTANGNYAIAGNGSKDAGGYIDSCNITVNDGATISAPKGVAIYHPEKGTVTINGGEISGHTGVQMCSGELIINDGSAITVNGNAVPKAENDGAILDGAAISIINRNYPGGTPTATISGGTFKSANGVDAMQVYAVSGTEKSDWTDDVAENINVSGGIFSTAVKLAWCAEGFIPHDNGDGTYTVKSKYVAMIGDTKYTTLSEALKAAAQTTSATVLLVADVDDEELVHVRAGVTLNLNGHSITKAALIIVTGQILDTADANKRGIISAEDYTITPKNAYTPVYDKAKGGYSLFNLWVKSEWISAQNKGRFAVGPDSVGERDAAKALLKADLSRVDAVITFSWTNVQGESVTEVTQSFTYNPDTVRSYLDRDRGVLTVVVDGLENIDASVTMQAKFVFYKADGAELFTLYGEPVPAD